MLTFWYFLVIPNTSFSSKGYKQITSKIPKSFHVEETWWRRKITSHPDEPTIFHMWLQMVITWSIFITLSRFFFHDDLKDVYFMPSFMCKVRKWMEVALRMQKIIGHFMIFGQLQQVITCSIFRDFEWLKLKNVIQEIYFIPSFLVKSKFLVEGHVCLQNIIGHF